MLPSKLYYKRQKKFSLVQDKQQEAILHCLDRIANDVYANNEKKRSFLSRLLGYTPHGAVQGLYLWGGVGRGKTMLMDIFFDALAIQNKRRLHFHRFMNEIHQLLNQHKQMANPLDLISAQIAKKSAVICLDEFHVSDITDAMILQGLLASLFKYHVCLMTTSNRKPDDLYSGGLQRERFLPAIELIKQHTEVLCLDNNTDYRLQTLINQQTYFSPIDKDSKTQMKALFKTMTTGETWDKHSININDRSIKVIRSGDGVAWFEFDQLCNTPRSQSDYLEIAREYHSIFISNIPQLSELDENAAKRFVNMIDILYDLHVKLILSADTPIKELYQGKQLTFEFERTISRIIEMQSESYLQQRHLD